MGLVSGRITGECWNRQRARERVRAEAAVACSGQNYHLRSLVGSRVIFTAGCFCALCLGTPKFTQAWGPLSSHDGARRARDRNSHAVVDVLHVVVDGRPSIGRRPERRDIVIGRVGDAFKPKIVLVVEPRENRAPAQAGVSAMGSEA